MKFFQDKNAGFTIVELLIVIVVIAILASITVVAYSGIQSRANDTAVQSDLRNISQQIEIYYAENGHYPRLLSEVESLKLRFTQGAYAQPSAGAHYTTLLIYSATPANSPDGNRYAIGAISKSNNRFYVSSNGSIQKWSTGSEWSGAYFMGVDSSSSLFTMTGRTSTGGWQTWANN